MRRVLLGLIAVGSFGAILYWVMKLVIVRQGGQGATFADYWPILGLLPLTCFGIVGYLWPDSYYSRRVRIVVPLGGWYDLTPRYSVRLRIGVACALAVLWNVVCIPLCVDFYGHGGPPGRPLGVFLCSFYLLAGLGLAVLALNYLWFDGRLKHLHVKTTHLPVTVRKIFEVRIETEFSRTMRPAMLRIGLVCNRAAHEYARWRNVVIPVRVKYVPVTEQWREVMMNQTVKRRQRLTLARPFDVPEDVMPSSPPDQLEEPWYLWEIQIKLIFQDGPVYKQTYPVLVDPLTVNKALKKPDLPERQTLGST